MPDAPAVTMSSEYSDLLSIVSDLATPCGRRIAKHLPAPYNARRAAVQVAVPMSEPGREGTHPSYMSESHIVTGWTLRTAPFFISDPHEDPLEEHRSVVFLSGNSTCAEPVNAGYLSLGHGRRQPLALYGALQTLRHELHDLLLMTPA